MADFLNSEAESDNSEEEGLDQHERKKLKKLKAMSDSEEEEDEDDEERIREELKDLIDDNPIDDESDGDDSEDSDAGRNKRKKSDDDDDLDDRLEDDDYDLIEENLGVKVERQKFKRLKRFDEESDGEDQMDDDRDAIANQLFDGDDDDERRVERHNRTADLDQFDEDDEDEESDADDFIVDDDGRPISEKKKKSKPRFHDQSLQEGQDIFGVDFDYDEFEKYDEDEYEEESDVDDDEYEDEDAERQRRNKKASRKKTMKKSIFEIYEPSELKRGHFTDLDNQIRKTDIPERMQLREVPVTKVPEGSNELDDEAEWIYEQAFCRPTISDQASFERDQNKKPQSTITKIKQALDFMRNQQLEVPFIAFYRKEYVQPELNINDLWKIYKYDARWCQLLSRKRNLLALFEKMRNFQLDKITENNETVPDDMRVLKDDDIERLKAVATPEELKDVHMQFLLYYASDIAAMKEDWLQKEKEKRRRERLQAKRKALEAEDGNVEDIELDDEEDEDLPEEPLKQARDTGPYAMCRKAGICGLAKRFGLTPEQFAMNLGDHYQRHEVEQEAIEPLELAKEYVSPKFTTSDEVIHAAKFVVARQISKEPMLRKTVREIFFERAKITVAPTKKGLKEIDENHPCFSLKYLKEKPVRHLKGIQFLRLCMAEEDKLITIIISDKINGNVSNSYLEEVKSLYQRDEFSKTVQDWNALRAECVELALNKMVLPDMRKELKSILLNEAKDAVLEACAQKLCGWLKMAPFKAKIQEEDDYDWETSKGIRVMGLAYVDDYSQAAFCALIGPDGDVTDYLRLPHILKRKNAFRSDEKEAKEAELITLQNFIRNKKPHVITIGGESRDALTIQQDIRGLIKQLNEEEQFPMISVEINDNELAKIYSNSVKGTSDFREYPDLLRQAVSLARRIQDPLVEYSQLCTADEEILCLRYHTLQDQLNKEELLDALYTEFINRTNEVGVDINQATQNPLTVNLVQFICGLGPRKGQALIKLLKQTNQRLENRTQLVTNCHMGPKVFINCSGFIKIDTNALGDSTEAYVEVLDGSRVHPETYEWARKMAVDALEYDDEDLNPAGALEEILESPERLKDLDLDAFAVELERQGFGNKSITLYDIREELNSRYKDLRQSYRTATAEQMFNMLTKETPEAFYVGKMVLAQVIGFSYKKPQADQLDQANPVRNDETRLWQCPFCMKNDFPELSEVWNHFDAGACPGQATGVKLRLDNGLSGFIHIKNLSDKHVKNPEERVQIGQTIHCRITKIDIERFSVDCTSKSSDLLDKNNEWRPSKDQYYDQEAEDKDLHKEDQSKQHRASQQYVRRVIFHPSFHNKSYAEAATLMKTMDQGEVIVRPSSKGTDHLTVMWKVTDEIYQHIDIREEGKENAFSLGQSLWIGNEEFEDLDEIIARHVNPMAAYARDLLGYKYYRDSSGGMKDKMEEFLKEEKRKNANKIHYFLSASKNYPGKFLLSYLPRNKCRHEYVTVTPDGFRFRQQMFDSVNSLLKWFKEHFRDPIPVATPIASTPHGSQSNRTPYGTPLGSTSAMSTEAIHKVAQNMPSHIMHSLSQVANQTPHYTQTPGYGQGGYVNTPYTPSGQTPFMTPYQTPHTSQTPRYGQGTPNQHSSGPFAHPGAPISAQRGGYPQASPHSYRSSPHVPSPRNRGGSYSTSHNKDNEDWDRASDAWASKTSRYSGGSRGSSGGGNWEKPNRPAWGRGGDRDRGGHNNRYNSKPQNTMPTITTTADEEDWDDAPSTEKSQPPKSTNSSSNYSNSSWNQNSRSNYKNNSYSTSGGASTSKDDRGWNKPNKGQPVILQNAADDEDWDNDVGSSNNLSEPSRDYQTMPSPRSVRSTPGTNTSPRSMTIGDATPLYDEN